jgi:hypothetical protein
MTPNARVRQVFHPANGTASASVLLFFDKERYLFNAGEGLQRLMREYKQRMAKVRRAGQQLLLQPPANHQQQQYLLLWLSQAWTFLPSWQHIQPSMCASLLVQQHLLKYKQQPTCHPAPHAATAPSCTAPSVYCCCPASIPAA